MGGVTRLAGMKVFHIDTCTSVFTCPTIQTVVLNNLDYLTESHVGKRKRLKLGASQRKGLFPRKFPLSPDSSSDHLHRKTGTETVTVGDGQDHTWTRTDPSYTPLSFYLNLNVMPGPFRCAEGVTGLLCFSSRCGHIEKIPLLCFLILFP